MKFGTPATQALIAFASVALLSSLRTASALDHFCDSPTTPTNNEGAVLVRFYETNATADIGADCPFECDGGE